MRAIEIERFGANGLSRTLDRVAEEEPLEIRLGTDHAGTRLYRGLGVTMRTPGADEELAAGFLFTEGILGHPGQIEATGAWDGAPNVVRVDLAPGVQVDWKRLKRHSYTTSSCGICGKASLELVERRITSRPAEGLPRVDTAVLQGLPGSLGRNQPNFEATGGMHAAALFTAAGQLIGIREDVGRHNAVDKLIGWHWRGGHSFAETVLLLSGRAGFELVQKAAVAGIGIVASIGAPTSLATELADQVGMTLIGFLREDRFNVYAGLERIRHSGTP